MIVLPAVGGMVMTLAATGGVASVSIDPQTPDENNKSGGVTLRTSASRLPANKSTPTLALFLLRGGMPCGRQLAMFFAFCAIMFNYW